MERVLGYVIGNPDPRIGGGDSFVDRLSCRHSVFLLIVFALVLTTIQWLGEVPIACWCPSHFTDSHVDFTNRACWTQNTYYLPITQTRIPKGMKGKQYISYYQWVALALICQAIMFYLPRPLWQVISKTSGISVSTVTDACVTFQRQVDPDNRDKTKRYMVKTSADFLVELSRNQLMANKCKTLWYWFYGNSLIVSYCCVKLLYLFNVIAQIVLLNKFLSTNYHMYGFEVLGKMLAGESWSTSDRFPRITLCDLQIRTLGNIHNYTIQCSLPLNLFNEKIYIFIWFWFAIVAVATFISLLSWVLFSAIMKFQVDYINRRLIAFNKLQPEDDFKVVSNFVRVFLRRDGLFIIRLVAKNSSDLVAAELICGLFDHYKDNKNIIQKLHSRNDDFSKKKKQLKSLLEREMSMDASSLNNAAMEVT